MQKILASGMTAAFILLTGHALAASKDVAEFYEGQTVSIVSPSGVGGSIYQYALLVSNHIGRHIPGSPSVVVEDRGGGGGMKAANYVENAASEDGLVIAELHPSSLVVPVTDDDVGFDYSNVQWLGSVAVRPYVGALWHTVETDTIEKARDNPIIFGSSGVGGSSYQYPLFVALASGAQIKVIPGYQSGGSMNLAMERGEIQGRGNYYEGFLATNPDWIKNGQLKFLFRMGDDHPDLMEVPHAREYLETDEHRKMFELLEAPLNVGQAFYVHGNVPAERVEALRKAFAEMLEDEEFLAEAEQLNLVIRPKGPDTVAAVVEEVYQTPRNIAADLAELFRE